MLCWLVSYNEHSSFLNPVAGLLNTSNPLASLRLRKSKICNWSEASTLLPKFLLLQIRTTMDKRVSMLVSEAYWTLVLLFVGELYSSSNLWQISVSAASGFKLVWTSSCHGRTGRQWPPRWVASLVLVDGDGRERLPRTLHSYATRSCYVHAGYLSLVRDGSRPQCHRRGIRKKAF